MRITIQNGGGFTQIGIPYEGKQLSLTMHEVNVLSNSLYKPIEALGWESEYQFEIWDSQGVSSWLVVNRDYVGDKLEVYWVDEVVDWQTPIHKKNFGDVFKMGRDVIETAKDLKEYMCYRYVNRTQIVGKPVIVGTQSWV
jgi:hypothetical protein